MRAIYKGGASILLCLSIGLSACAAPESRPQQAAPSASMDAPGKAYHTIDAQQAKAMLDGQPQTLLVDVRTQPEYAAGHIPGAICIPLDTIQSRPAQLPDLQATILVYCRSGVRSQSAADRLASLGYTAVYDMGGIQDWPYQTTK